MKIIKIILYIILVTIAIIIASYIYNYYQKIDSVDIGNVIDQKIAYLAAQEQKKSGQRTFPTFAEGFVQRQPIIFYDIDNNPVNYIFTVQDKGGKCLGQLTLGARDIFSVGNHSAARCYPSEIEMEKLMLPNNIQKNKIIDSQFLSFPGSGFSKFYAINIGKKTIMYNLDSREIETVNDLENFHEGYIEYLTKRLGRDRRNLNKNRWQEIQTKYDNFTIDDNLIEGKKICLPLDDPNNCKEEKIIPDDCRDDVVDYDIPMGKGMEVMPGTPGRYIYLCPKNNEFYVIKSTGAMPPYWSGPFMLSKK